MGDEVERESARDPRDFGAAASCARGWETSTGWRPFIARCRTGLRPDSCCKAEMRSERFTPCRRTYHY